MATTLKVKLMPNGEPAELSFRNGEGEKLNHGGAILGVRSNGSKPVEIWLSGTDRKALGGLLR